MSCVLLALAAVGRIMRERKSPFGAALVVDARESGRFGAAVDEAREVLAERVPAALGAGALGRAVVEGLRVIF